MRKLGYDVISLVQLIRFFGFIEGLTISVKILWSKHNSVVKVNSKKFKNPVEIRKSHSDLPIFYQVFCELQYDITFFLNYKPNFIIDCGSNVGYSCLYFSTLFPTAKIIGIEPQKENYNQFKKNIINYDNIKAINGAIWHRNIAMSIKNENDPSASFEVEEAQNAESAIRGVTIDALIEKNNLVFIDILKIDIEGAEYDLFKNNPHSWLTKTRCLIIELHDLVRPGISKTFFSEMSKYNWNTIIRGENIVCFKRD